MKITKLRNLDSRIFRRAAEVFHVPFMRFSIKLWNDFRPKSQDHYFNARFEVEEFELGGVRCLVRKERRLFGGGE